MLSKNQIKLIRSLETKKGRHREQLFVAEGPKVVGDLLRGKFSLYQLFSTTADWPDAQIVTEEELQKISFLKHPQNVLAIFRTPTNASVPEPKDLCLALDGVQDPGNVGTIIRIADWFGIKTVYCSLDVADIYNPKVVQATMGSIAHVNVFYTDLLQLIEQLPPAYPVYGTFLDGDNIYEESLSHDGLIVMGNEGNGISSLLRSKITRKLLIPNFGTKLETAESLNVAIATAVTCSEFKRRMTGK